MKEQIPSLLPGFTAQLSPSCLAGAVGSLFPQFWPFFHSQRVGAVWEAKYKLSSNVARLFPGEILSWWVRGAHQSLAHLLVILGLRCCWDFLFYMGIGNLVQTLRAEGYGLSCWLCLGYCENSVRWQGRCCSLQCSAAHLSPCSALQTEPLPAVQPRPLKSPAPGRLWLRAPSPCSPLSKPQIRLKYKPVHSVLLVGRELRGLCLEPQTVFFGGHCELTWLWGCFTLRSRQARLDPALPREAERKGGRHTHGVTVFCHMAPAPCTSHLGILGSRSKHRG